MHCWGVHAISTHKVFGTSRDESLPVVVRDRLYGHEGYALVPIHGNSIVLQMGEKTRASQGRKGGKRHLTIARGWAYTESSDRATKRSAPGGTTWCSLDDLLRKC